ncbi:MAG: hypothetical protein MJ101_04050, partial [Clostridia bacterium]|nr:hypothetical protein [Clostridia bacterium]
KDASRHHVPRSGTHRSKNHLLSGRQKVVFCWRRMGDSNPRGITPKRFQEYTRNKDELTVLPLIYKLMLFGRPYYYGALFGLMNDHDKLKEMLEFIQTQITLPDEISFRKILSK